MFKLSIGYGFEFAYECHGLFVRIGKREWFYSREQGFAAGVQPE